MTFFTPMRVALAVVCVCAFTQHAAEARVNASSALDVFMITDCAECTKDGDSIFCSEAKSNDNFVSNGTKFTIAQKKARFGPADGAKYCWDGTFGKLLHNQGNYSDLLGSVTVLVSLECSQQNLFYRQCVSEYQSLANRRANAGRSHASSPELRAVPSEMAIILISVASVVFVLATTCILFWCGCCKCCNNKGDESRWGMCNRFCPWMPCSDPPKPEEHTPGWHTNPISEEEQSKSLFGRSTALKAVELKPRSLSDLKKPDSKSAV